MVEDKDPRVLLGYASQAWSDIRSYTSNIWQVSAVCLTIVFLLVNISFSSINNAESGIGWFQTVILLFSLTFVMITLYTVNWLRTNIAKRVELISKIALKLDDIKGPELTVPLGDLFGIGDGPLVAIEIFFYGLASAFSALLAYPSIVFIISLIISFPVVIDIASWMISTLTIIVSIPLLYNSTQRYLATRKSEGEAVDTILKAFLYSEISDLKDNENVLRALGEDILPEIKSSRTTRRRFRSVFLDFVLLKTFEMNYKNIDLSIWVWNESEPLWRCVGASSSVSERIKNLQIRKIDLDKNKAILIDVKQAKQQAIETTFDELEYSMLARDVCYLLLIDLPSMLMDSGQIPIFKFIALLRSTDKSLIHMDESTFYDIIPGLMVYVRNMMTIPKSV